jgi:very-short-patch-repair endonuclease
MNGRTGRITPTHPSPIDGGGLGGGDASRLANRGMKKHPVDGAHARARALRQHMTEAERRVWQILRTRQIEGHRFRRQVPIGRYIADFVCHQARLILEIDGGHHDRWSLREAGRAEFLQNEGYRILRFWNNEILESLDGVAQTIAAALAASPHPTLPIKGRAL